VNFLLKGTQSPTWLLFCWLLCFFLLCLFFRRIHCKTVPSTFKQSYT